MIKICLICKKEFKPYFKKQKTCSRKCGYKQAKKTNLKNLGVEHPAQSEKIKNKMKETNLKKLGVEYPMQSKKVQEKSKQTNLENLGVKNPFQSEEIKEKIKEINLENLGVENPMQSKKVQEKMKQTKLKNYSNENYNNREKNKQTNLKNLGVKNPFQSEQIKEKIKQTNLENLGVEYYAQTIEFRKNARARMIKNLESRHGQISPNYNPSSIPILEQKAKELGITDLEHAENGGEFHIKELNYWVDAYSKEKNIVIEFYEKYHKRTTERDKRRREEIINFLECQFIEIWEK